ncbi:MAG: hypothetical protein QXH37_09615, partial [Candidatus Bathyarchaeia archaeon]
FRITAVKTNLWSREPSILDWLLWIGVMIAIAVIVIALIIVVKRRKNRNKWRCPHLLLHCQSLGSSFHFLISRDGIQRISMSVQTERLQST